MPNKTIENKCIAHSDSPEQAHVGETSTNEIDWETSDHVWEKIILEFRRTLVENHSLTSEEYLAASLYTSRYTKMYYEEYRSFRQMRTLMGDNSLYPELLYQEIESRLMWQMKEALEAIRREALLE